MATNLEKILSKCHPTNEEKVKREWERAKNSKGPTLFDLLVEIIHSSQVDLILD